MLRNTRTSKNLDADDTYGHRHLSNVAPLNVTQISRISQIFYFYDKSFRLLFILTNKGLLSPETLYESKLSTGFRQ